MHRNGIDANWEDYLPDFHAVQPTKEFIHDFNRVKSIIIQVAQLPISRSLKDSILFKLGGALEEINIGAFIDDDN